MRQKLIILLLFLLSACSFIPSTASQISPTPTPLPFATATLMSTFTPRPSATKAPPTIAPTIAPIIGVLTNQVNVRTGPDKNAKSLGLLNYGARVQVIGKDTGGNWWEIIYPENTITTAWVSASYVQVPESDVDKIPVIQIAATDTPRSSISSNETITPTIPKGTATQPTRTAKVTNQINVRSGPGQNFTPLALINAGTVVVITGRNQNNMWIQILYEGGTDGKGWVAAAYLDGVDLNGLPYFDNNGNLISAGSISGGSNQATLSPTAFSPAATDGDSLNNPMTQVNFSPEGSREFTLSGDVSAPNGDSSDWVAFTPYEPTGQTTYVYLKLTCVGNGGITAVLKKNGVAVPDVKPLVCGNYDMAMKVLGGQKYTLELDADGSGGPLRYAQYTLIISTVP